jgi:hypothetical protein
MCILILKVISQMKEMRDVMYLVLCVAEVLHFEVGKVKYRKVNYADGWIYLNERKTMFF